MKDPSFDVVGTVELRRSHQPTGFTKHYQGSGELPTPRSLKIARYQDDPGCYLLYYDEAGNELTDTYHDSLEDAMRQATLEFGLKPEDWTLTT